VGNRGYYVAPTVVCDVAPDADIVRDEVFGPVLTVQEFETEEQAVALAKRLALRPGGQRLDRKQRAHAARR